MYATTRKLVFVQLLCLSLDTDVIMFLWLDIRRRIQLIQDFEMPTVSNCISISNDGRYIFATGKP